MAKHIPPFRKELNKKQNSIIKHMYKKGGGQICSCLHNSVDLPGCSGPKLSRMHGRKDEDGGHSPEFGLKGASQSLT